jgi:hypothetical protein
MLRYRGMAAMRRVTIQAYCAKLKATRIFPMAKKVVEEDVVRQVFIYTSYQGKQMPNTRPLSHQQPTRLHNIRCAYCNAEFTDPNEPEKEHVIGRNFVPKGTHNQQWNLHVNSCHICNEHKSKLENDLSAITLHPDPGQMEVDSLRWSEAERKSKTYSQRTGKPVADSIEEVKLSGKMGIAEVTFSLSSKPQFDKNRAFELAGFQLRGFFFLLTYDAEQQMGNSLPGYCMPIGALPISDWGNPLVLSFANYVKDWDMRFLVVRTAQGFFGVVIKKHPTEALWSWALEWNKSTRLFGFLGDRAKAQEIVDVLEVPQQSSWIKQPAGNKIRDREEVPLPSDTDDLFFFAP